jgi:hypothetical protein
MSSYSSSAAAEAGSPWSRRLLRAASVVFVLYAWGHTYGAMFHDNTRGPRQAALFAAMRDYTFVVQGQTRSYWTFYRGFGFYVSLALALLAVLTWQLGALSRSHPRQARPLVATLFVSLVAMTALTWVDFFPAPTILSVLCTALVGGALLSLARAGTRGGTID